MNSHIPREILLVEDDVLSRYLTEQIIRRTFPNTKIRFFEDGQKFMDYFHTTSTPKGVVLLDLNMPNKNGFECLEEMSRFQDIKSCPVFILTSSISRIDRHRAKSYPMVIDYVEKPFDFRSAKTLLTFQETEVN